jgi:hypothetical protein
VFEVCSGLSRDFAVRQDLGTLERR